MHFWIEMVEGLAISFRAIRANKMRSVLTTLGIVIGIVSVTLMATAIEGVNRAFEKSASAFGTDVMYVEKWPWVDHEDWSTVRNRRDIKLEYAAAVKGRAKKIFLVHGEPEVAAVFQEKLMEQGITNVEYPAWRQTVEL